MQTNQTKNSPAPAAPAVDQYEAEIPLKNAAPVAIARVLAKSDYLKGNAIGDRISIDPHKAAWLEKHGVVIREARQVSPLAIRDAGGIEAYLKQNPKEDMLSASIRSRLRPMPGIPTGETKKKPWDLVEI